MTFRQLCARYLRSCRATCGNSSALRSKSILKTFREFKVEEGRQIQSLQLAQIKKRHVQQYLDARAGQEKTLKDGSTRRPAPGTVKREQIVLSAIFTWAIEQEYLPEGSHPARKAKVARAETKKERILTEAEEQQLLKVCRNPKSPRLAYLEQIILTALNTGMREDELLSLTWGSVNLDGCQLEDGTPTSGTITVLSTNDNPTKSRRTRHVPITPELRPLLSGMREVVMGKEQATPAAIRDRYVFINPRTGTRWIDTKAAWRSALRKAGITGLRFHDLRHTFATRFRQKGGGLDLLQQILGHESITTTMRYAHVAKSELYAAMNKLGTTAQRQSVATSAAVGSK